MNKTKLEKIYRMTQKEVKQYAYDYLVSSGYTVINQDGFLYAKGNVPVLLVAHMDTVHKEPVKDIIYSKNDEVISSPQGIGGDDRNGVAIILEIVKELKCSVLLCEDEEIGTVGARKFAKTDYIKNLGVNYMVEFDRKGSNDAVFYSCDNPEFTNFVTDFTGFKKAYSPSCSDISVLMPASGIAAVNLSSGYYNAHTLTEYVVYDEMLDTIEAAKLLIREECEKPFEYIERKYTYEPSKYFGSGDYERQHYYNDIFSMPAYRDEALYRTAKKDKEIELEVRIDNEDTVDVLYSSAASKAECWMNFFMDNPDICWNDIIDYDWC